MRFVGNIIGFCSDLSTGDVLRKRNIQVNYTSDFRGKTLSLGSIEDKVQITIPFDELSKLIEKEDKRK